MFPEEKIKLNKKATVTKLGGHALIFRKFGFIIIVCSRETYVT